MEPPGNYSERVKLKTLDKQIPLPSFQLDSVLKEITHPCVIIYVLNLLERVLHLRLLHNPFPVITHFSRLTAATLYCEFHPDIHYGEKNQ